MMSEDWLTVGGFLFLVGVLVLGAIKSKKNASEFYGKKWEKEDAKEDPMSYLVNGTVTEDVAEDAFVFVKYRGVVLSMRVNEKRELWDTMNRLGKNEHVDAIKKAVKQGKVKVEKLADDVWLYVPVQANLVKIREDYAKFKIGGGQIIEE